MNVIVVVVEGIMGVIWWRRRVAVSRTGRGATSEVAASWGCSGTVSSWCRLGRVVEAVAWAAGVGTGEGSAHNGEVTVWYSGYRKVKLFRAGEVEVRRGRFRVLI